MSLFIEGSDTTAYVDSLIVPVLTAVDYMRNTGEKTSSVKLTFRGEDIHGYKKKFETSCSFGLWWRE